ncbi:MAG: hypothetical protein A2W90_00690 [Bacteroidetes bacterium GWF2_42_66]|nr:MAG: hypothetical protein A2W89_12090 [Bacteroidetes bacterium GWE2_42_39]OFY40425.1 MAG: hypothetical protein A2W90_00690 [Bacteroidetes bacterium GWF2_42_66]HBL76954.1 hypothetical protein [Prolixibacteraceae bacterium]HCR89102.1 hypothetical protein [Prolixibacteraceae bacterium]HCU62665.1 hypothetical protein [Prolixibacteraceae bacterium]
MKKIADKIRSLLSQNLEKGIFENKIFSIVTFVVTITCFVAVIMNLFVGSYLIMNLILGLFGFSFGILFYLSFFRGITRPLIIPFQILVILALILSWFHFQGIEGSTAMFFFPAIFLIIYTYSGKKYWIILISFISVVIGLTAIHYLYPEWVLSYVNEELRIIDLFVSFVITLFIMGFATIILKKNFDLERSKTQQKNRELEISEARFRDIAMSSGDWIWEIDANSVYTFCSEKVEDILGYSPNEMIGKTPFDFMPETETGKVRDEFLQIVREQKPFRNLENWNITKTGRLICALTSGVPVIDGQGNLVGYRGTDTDITERKRAEEALNHSHNLMHYIIEHSNGGIAVHDRDMKYIYVSQRYLDEYKVKERDIIGRHHYDIFPDLPQKWRDVHQKALAGEVSSADNDPYVREDGSVEWTRWECRPWYESDGTIGGIIVYTEVITERKHAELALSESESRFDQLAEHSRTIAWEINKDGLFTYISHVAEQLLGYSTEEMIGKKYFYDFAPEQEREFIKSAASAAFNRKDSFIDFENLVETKDGHSIWFAVNGFPILDADNRLIGYRGSITDITKRKQTEEALIKSYELLTKLAEQVPGVIYQYRLYPDGKSYFPYSSMGMMDIYGVTPEEVREDATPVFGRLHPDDLDHIVSSINESARTQQLYHSEFRVILPGQGVRWRLCDAKPERMEDGSTLWYGIISDITERKQAEAELLEAKKRAEESDRLKSAFLANMSHEIRTPMNSIMGFASLLPEEESKELITKYSQIIVQNSEQLVNLIDGIVLYSKLQTNMVPLRNSKIKIMDVFRDIQLSFQLDSIQKGVELTVDCDETYDWMLTTDYDKLRQIIANLVSNAFKYTQQGCISIGYKQTESLFQFFVKDTGIGIPQEELVYVFDRFFRGSNIDESIARGTGLGLSIVKELVHLLGGRIWVESEMNKGSTFYFTIPCEN